MSSSRTPSVRLRHLLAALTLGALVPATAPAAVKTIWPDQLRLWNADGVLEQQQNHVRNLTAAPAALGAPVRLPVGSVVTRVVYFHHGAGAGETSVTLVRVRMGSNAEILRWLFSADNSSDIIPVESNASPGHTVEAGYRYYVRGWLRNEQSTIHGIKIYYTPPGP